MPLLTPFETVKLEGATFDALNDCCQEVVQNAVSVAMGIPSGNAASEIRKLPATCQSDLISLVANDASFKDVKSWIKDLPGRLQIAEQQAKGRAAKAAAKGRAK